MSARLQRRVTPPHARAEKLSEFERIRQALDGHLAKAVDAREHLLESSYDPKLLHAWRVGLRRVTATLKDVARFSDDNLDDVLEYLRLCREATGACRDLDILAQETLPAFVGKDGAKAEEAQRLADAVAKQQQQAHRQALSALREHSLAIPLQAWRHWANTLEPPTDSAVRHAAAVAIEQRFNALKKRASKLDGGQKRLHRLRSATKKLRYNIELYQHVFPKQNVTSWLKHLADLQGHLGTAHDRMMGRKLVGSLMVTETDLPKLKAFRRWSKQTAFESSKNALTSLAKLQKLSPYWRAHAH